MKDYELLKAMGKIRPEYIEEAAAPKTRKKRSLLLKAGCWAALAAGLALAVLLGMNAPKLFSRVQAPEAESTSSSTLPGDPAVINTRAETQETGPDRTEAGPAGNASSAAETLPAETGPEGIEPFPTESEPAETVSEAPNQTFPIPATSNVIAPSFAGETLPMLTEPALTEPEESEAGVTHPDPTDPAESVAGNTNPSTGDTIGGQPLKKIIAVSPYIFRGVCVSETDENDMFPVSVQEVFRGDVGTTVWVYPFSGRPAEPGKEYLFLCEKHGNVILDRVYFAAVDFLWADGNPLQSSVIEDADQWTYDALLQALPELVRQNPLEEEYDVPIYNDYIHSSDSAVIREQSDYVVLVKALEQSASFTDRMWYECEVCYSEKGDLRPGSVFTAIVPKDSMEAGGIYTVCLREAGGDRFYIISAPDSIWLSEE